MTSTAELLHEVSAGCFIIAVYYVRWSGGGEGYEYAINDGQITNHGYGCSSSAFRAAWESRGLHHPDTITYTLTDKGRAHQQGVES